tara:strand:- start:63 stop:494 length:432 start_codon:yes stop_codon:yes gene_type:complete
MNWEKLTKNKFHQQPVEYIHAMDIFRQQEYDRLYENQNNLEHKAWHEFDSKYRIGYEFKEDITDIDFNKEVIALWLFRERSDNRSGPLIDVAGKQIAYTPNTFILTKSKNIKIQESKKKYIRRPMIQLDVSAETFDKICARFK